MLHATIQTWPSTFRRPSPHVWPPASKCLARSCTASRKVGENKAKSTPSARSSSPPTLLRTRLLIAHALQTQSFTDTVGRRSYGDFLLFYFACAHSNFLARGIKKQNLIPIGPNKLHRVHNGKRNEPNKTKAKGPPVLCLLRS